MAILRKGMWATHAGSVGIIAAIGPQAALPLQAKAIPAGYLDFHVVDEKGETVAEVVVDCRAVAQAPYLAIPEARRPSEAVARTYGYL